MRYGTAMLWCVLFAWLLKESVSINSTPAPPSIMSTNGPSGKHERKPSDAFAMMMSSSQRPSPPSGKKVIRNSRKKPSRASAGTDLWPAALEHRKARLYTIPEAREEMLAMGFEGHTVERALRLHAHGGLRVDLEYAVASCVASASEGSSVHGNSSSVSSSIGRNEDIDANDADDSDLAPREENDHEQQVRKRLKRSSESTSEVIAASAHTVPASKAQTCANVSSTEHKGACKISSKVDVPALSATQCEPACLEEKVPQRTAGASNLCAFLGVADLSVPQYFFLDWHARSVNMSIYTCGVCISRATVTYHLPLNSISGDDLGPEPLVSLPTAPAFANSPRTCSICRSARALYMQL